MDIVTAGESHGKGVVCIVKGLPSGLEVDEGYINEQLRRRQGGYGRGGRMEIETDEVQIISGVYKGETIGSPVTFLIENDDWKNWKDVFEPRKGEKKGEVTKPRPGHADLAGSLKRGFRDVRKVLERASARETAARVAGAALARLFLKKFDVSVVSRVVALGGIKDMSCVSDYASMSEEADKSPLRVLDKKVEGRMMKEIEKAGREGDSLGGIFEVVATGLPPGIGDYTCSEKKLDGLLAGAIMSIPAIKSVEIGLGRGVSEKKGSAVQDEIFYDRRKGGFFRKTNRAGGLEGGVTNGEPLIVRASMKPIPTLSSPLATVDIRSGEIEEAAKERSDVCAVPAASIVGEAELGKVLCSYWLDKFGCDSMDQIEKSFSKYVESLEGWFESS